MRNFILLAMLLSSSALAQEAPLRLSHPVDCPPDLDCVIQKYVDAASGPVARDFQCGLIADNGHKGTDFRVPLLSDLDRNIPIIAAADGIVTDTRDWLPDQVFSVLGRDFVVPLGLGNRVVISHQDGWVTAYGHLKMGSITVQPGQRVARGETLGFMGLSGLTEFPHLHFQLSKRVTQTNPNTGTRSFSLQTVDPFTGLPSETQCGRVVSSLWTPDTLRKLVYRPTWLVGLGFSEAELPRTAFMLGLHQRAQFSNKLDSFFVTAQIAGLAAGDRVIVAVRNQRGQQVFGVDQIWQTSHLIAELSGPIRIPAEGLAQGVYTARLQVVRTLNDNSTRIIVDQQASTRITPALSINISAATDA